MISTNRMTLLLYSCDMHEIRVGAIPCGSPCSPFWSISSHLLFLPTFPLPLSKYSKNCPFSTHPIPLTRLDRPVSAITVAIASRHTESFLTPSSPPAPPLAAEPELDVPGAFANTSPGKKDGDEGELDGCRVRTVSAREAVGGV